MRISPFIWLKAAFSLCTEHLDPLGLSKVAAVGQEGHRLGKAPAVSSSFPCGIEVPD